jgi:hypothetical protein
VLVILCMVSYVPHFPVELKAGTRTDGECGPLLCGKAADVGPNLSNALAVRAARQVRAGPELEDMRVWLERTLADAPQLG